ncbi:hypothetical protein Q1695_014391 [Nippostrongylus brasiliensis]|nr:hypothetical protein Q1695_014391 [Nippostrongylus brasiliensis]
MSPGPMATVSSQHLHAVLLIILHFPGGYIEMILDGAQVLLLANTTNFAPNLWVKHIVHFSPTIFEAVTKFIASVVICFPKSSKIGNSRRRLEELPNEILLKILTYCDFTSKMNMRASAPCVCPSFKNVQPFGCLYDLRQNLELSGPVNSRFCGLVERGAHSLARRNLVGGVEIRRSGSDDEETFDPGEGPSCSYSSVRVALYRPLKRLKILIPAARLKNVMRHVCVCHSLKLYGVSLDEDMATNILYASFRTVSDMIIDRVHTVTAETLMKLVRKAHPSNRLIFCNHSSTPSSEAITPESLLFCSARDISIEPSIVLLHRSFDDAALVRLVVSDHAIRRAIRLPLCAITHRGISDAAQAFYKRCCDVLAELRPEMHAPLWEISVSFPYSMLIDRNLIEVPAEMRGQCTIWSFFPKYGDSFTVEVRVGTMNLRIVVESQ